MVMASISYRTPDGKTREIPVSHLRHIRSRVKTHEGEFLSGRKGEQYIDKYSAKYLGKDLKNSYRDSTVK